MIPTCGTLDDTSLRQIDMISQRALGTGDKPSDCRWLISLDYDGTLRHDEAPYIDAEFFEQMAAWREHGVRWGINTGRSLYFLLEDYTEISAVLPDFICTCERYAYVSDDAGMLHACHRYNVGCDEDHIALRARLGEVIGEEFKRMGERNPEVEWEIDDSDPLSIAAADPESMEKLMPTVYEIQSRYPELGMQRAGRFMRYCDGRYSKGSALDQVRKHWEVEEAHCFIMGDGENDLDTFKHFPTASCAAPTHSHVDVLNYVNARGGDTQHERVIDALRRWAKEQGIGE